jgi:hypothetical protein
MSDVANSHISHCEVCDVSAPFRFQERDGEILRAIYTYDGVLAKRHVKRMFWPDASERAMEMRLALLNQHNYLTWPSLVQWRTKPIPEAVYWLGWNGAQWIASNHKLDVKQSSVPSETQLRQLVSVLRQHGIRWLREPRWSQLVHDLAVVDVRLAVEKAARETTSLILEEWIPEGAFLSKMDEVVYNTQNRNRAVKQVRRGVRPDGYCVIVDRRRQYQGLPARARLLLELDMATHDTESFLREKVSAGVAYIQSGAYKTRFGHNSGRWLVVTTGTVRLKHLMQQTQRAARERANIFFFTTLDRMQTVNVLTSSIWWQVGQDKPTALFAV